MAKRLITTINGPIFFGERLSKEPKFMLAAEEYLDDLFMTAEIIRLIPSILAPLVAPILMRQHTASKTLICYLTREVENRLQQDVFSGPLEAKPLDCIQFFVDASRKQRWDAAKIVQVLLRIWFAAVHQPALCLVYTLDDLCRHPEYVPLLRKKLEGSANDHSKSSSLLESFIKESARLHPSDSISVRRLAVQSYTFSDGTHISTGDVACVPLQAILRDPTHYPDNLTFDGSRLVNQSKFTEVSPTFPLWGLGRHAW